MSGILHFFLYHVAELDLYLGILPFAALARALARAAPADAGAAARSPPPRSRLASGWSPRSRRSPRRATSTGSRSGTCSTSRRFALIALLGAGRRRRRHAPPPRARRGRGRRGRAAVLHPVHALHHDERRLRHLRAAAVVVGAGPPDPPRRRCAGPRSPSSLAAAALFVFLPRRYALVLPALVARLLRRARPSSSRTAATGSTRRPSARSGRARTCSHPDWIDRLVGQNATVVGALDGHDADRPTRSGRTSSSTAASARSTTSTAPRGPTRCPRPTSTRQPNGELATADGKPVHAQYVLASGNVELAGKRIATRPGRRRPLPRRRADRDPHAA